jgi:uncharacterized delta-60 repeat protein
MFRGIFLRLATVASLTGLASFGLLGAAPSGFAAGGAGSLDPTFGRGGEVVTSLGTNQVATDAILQPNGDIVVSVGIGAVRYLPSGSLDSTFGSGGFALAQPGFLGGALTLQSDGKIVVVGNTELAGGGENFVVARFNPNGSPDSTFGSGGVVTTAFPGASATEIAAAVLQQPDGKILVGGTAQAPGRTSPSLGALARYNPNGSLDPTFGSGGEVLSQPASVIRTLGLDAAGDIFVLPTHREFSPGGQLDPGVTPATITVSSHGGIGLGNGGVFLSTGQSVIGGTVFINRSDTDAQVQRFNAGGSLDATFTNPPFDYGTQEAGRDGAAAVAIQSNGQIVAVGGHFFGTEPSGVARLNTNGSLDAGFGNGGTVTTSFPGGFGYAAVVIQTDGKIVAVGGASDPTTGLTNLTLARYL